MSIVIVSRHPATPKWLVARGYVPRPPSKLSGSTSMPHNKKGDGDDCEEVARGSVVE